MLFKIACGCSSGFHEHFMCMAWYDVSPKIVLLVEKAVMVEMTLARHGARKIFSFKETFDIPSMIL